MEMSTKASIKKESPMGLVNTLGKMELCIKVTSQKGIGMAAGGS